MLLLFMGVAVAALFVAYDGYTLLTTKDQERKGELVQLAVEDIPQNRSKVFLRMLTARIVLYVLIAAVGMFIIFLIQRFIPKRR